MQALGERYADRLLIVGVDWGEATDSVADFVARYEVRYPIVLDPTLDTFYAWNPIDGLPRHFFVDGHGVVVRQVIGPLHPDAMVTILEELLGAASPDAARSNGVRHRSV